MDELTPAELVMARAYERRPKSIEARLCYPNFRALGIYDAARSCGVPVERIARAVQKKMDQTLDI